MEINVADYIPLLNIGSAFAERKYKCRIDANFRYADKSARKAFEVIDSRARGWGDLPTIEKAAIVGRCVDEILREVAHFSSEMIKK